MILEAVTVCVQYADFLAETVRYNAQHFHCWVIVTAPSDKETLELCRKRNLQCVVMDELDACKEEKFNKGRGIALGFNYLSSNAWVLHIDADVVLPPLTKQMLRLAKLDPTCIYGADRIEVKCWDDWQKLQASGYLHDQHGFHLCCNFPEKYHVGTRVIRGNYGYVPIGFFQLFHNQHGVHAGMRWKDYPDADSDAAHSDIKFALHWDRRKRVLLPELVVVHLESERVPFGANWRGRKTKRFGPHRHHHHHHHPPKPYC